MKKHLAVLAALILCALCLAGCSRYSSHYNAVGFVHSNTSDEASMSFLSFSGTMVFTLHCDENGESVEYGASLGSGSLRVFLDTDGTKTEWFTLREGETVRSASAPVPRGTVYVIVEADGECRDGRLDFDLD